MISKDMLEKFGHASQMGEAPNSYDIEALLESALENQEKIAELRLAVGQLLTENGESRSRLTALEARPAQVVRYGNEVLE